MKISVPDTITAGPITHKHKHPPNVYCEQISFCQIWHTKKLALDTRAVMVKRGRDESNLYGKYISFFFLFVFKLNNVCVFSGSAMTNTFISIELNICKCILNPSTIYKTPSIHPIHKQTHLQLHWNSLPPNRIWELIFPSHPQEKSQAFPWTKIILFFINKSNCWYSAINERKRKKTEDNFRCVCVHFIVVCLQWIRSFVFAVLIWTDPILFSIIIAHNHKLSRHRL